MLVPSSPGGDVAAKRDDDAELALSCPICLELLKSPMMLPCCQQTFCKRCLRQALSSTSRCPLCRATIDVKSLKEHAADETIAAAVRASVGEDVYNERLEAHAKRPRHGAHSFTALTYNILARSLGSNTIPWCIAIDAAFRERVEAATSTKWSAFKSATLTPEYKVHFHKNFAAGEYTAMRAFWAARKCASAADLPASLPHLRFVAEDTVAYTADGAERVATTLRGLLRRALPEPLALELFSHIVAAEEAGAPHAWRQSSTLSLAGGGASSGAASSSAAVDEVGEGSCGGLVASQTGSAPLSRFLV